MPKIRVLLVDDHEVVRMGLRSLFELEDDITVVGEASDGREAVARALELTPDIVLMDIRMGDTDGVETCREVRSVVPGASVIMLTSFGTDESVLGALMAGASGFLLKNTARADLLRAVRLVSQGQSLLDPAVTAKVTQRLVALATKSGPSELADLSPREREVLELVARGKTNREIAEILVISDATARNHVSHILEKLGMSRRSEAAALAAKLGLLRDPE